MKKSIILTLILFVCLATMAQTPYVIWCSDNTTLYFTYRSEELSVNGLFIPEGETDSHTITALWSGNQVTDSPETPDWNSYVGNACTTAIIESSFIDVKPKSLSRWFCYNINSYGGTSNLTTINGFANLNTEDVTIMSELFRGCRKLENLNISNFNTTNVTDMQGMFWGCSKQTSLDLSHFDTSSVENMSYMFDYCQNLSELDLSSFNTSNVTNMQNMFYDCGKLTSLDLSSFNTTNVTNMYGMFYNCQNLSELNLSSFNTSNVTDMQYMFYYCNNLTSLDLSSFNTSNVTNMQYMFYYCSKLTSLDLSSFNTSNVTSMQSMFSECSNLTSLDLSRFNTSNVTNMQSMFYNCNKLTSLNLSRFNTLNVTNMKSMFSECSKLTSLDLSSFNTSMVNYMNYMFYDCESLHTIIVSDLWSLNRVPTGQGQSMFSGCTSLVGGRGTVYDNSHLSCDYAHIDEVGNPGYLTASNTNVSLEPDLIVQKIEIDKQAINPGESFLITWVTSNIGEQQNTGGWSEQVSFVSETGEPIKELELLTYNDVLSGESFVNHQLEVTLPFLLGIDGKVRIQVKIIPNESTGEPEEAQENNTQVSNLVYTINKLLRLEIAPLRVTEGIANEVQVTLSRSAAWNQNQNFNISISEDGRIQNPSSVTMPSGQSSMSFSISITDNNVFDTDSIITIIAERSGYTAAQTQFILVDDELSEPDEVRTPYVVWCSENSTLYFTNSSKPLSINGTFTPEGETSAIVITNLWSAEQVTSSSSTPKWSGVISSCKQVIFEESFQNVRPTRTSKWFYSGRKINAISGLNYLNTEEVTAMNEMFYHCDLVTSLDVSHFNTEKVTNMLSMFDNCYSVQSLDVSHFNTSKCTTMKHMFQGCNKLTEIDLSNFDTKNVTTMFCMFNDSYSLTRINLGNFDTSSVTNMALMFNGCRSLPDIDLSSFDTSKVGDMHNMFYGCSSLTSLDLSNFNTSNVTNMSYMFNGCNQLNKIIVSDLWSVKRVTSGDNMFNNCTSLEGGKGTIFDNSHITYDYAHIDEVGYPGYFTASNETVCIQPDLTVRKINIDKQTINPGEHITITWVTANFGKQPTTGGWSERVSLVSESGGAIKEIATLDFEETLAGESFTNHQAEIDLPFLLGIEGKVKALVEIIPNESTGEPEDMQANNIQSSDMVVTVNNLLKLEIAPSRVLENKVTEVQAILSRSGAWNLRHYFYLYFSEDSRIQKLSGVTIPSGQSSVSFTINITDNNVFDTDSIVTVEARRSGYTSSKTQFIIVDDEMPKLDVTTSKSELSEGETFELTVTTDHAPSSATSLMLTSDNSVRFDFPSKLTLPAGETTVSTTVTVIEDNDIADAQSAAFTVSAEGYKSGEAIVMVNDNDMPHLELILAPTVVSTSTGSNAIMGTIRRTDNLNSKLTVVLSDDAEGKLSYSSQQITLERGVTEAHFTISTNGNISVDQEVNITAAVYVKTCNCTAGTQSGGSTTQSLTLLASEGSAMTIEPLTTDIPSDSNQGGFIITLESPAQQDLVVNVTSDFDDNLEYEHIVTIPAGETSVTIPVIRKAGEEIPEGKIITFTATAAGYASAACWTIATASSMPDAVITSFEVSAKEAEAGSEVELTVVVKNTGSGQLNENTSIKVTLSDGSYPIVLKTEKSLSSGESTTITTSYQLPLLTGDYTFLATVNPAGKVEEAVTANNISQEIPITITPNYHLTTHVDKTTYGQGELITVTGKATGSGSAFADVEVYFINDDMRQTVTAKTDAEGNYSAVFLPLDGTSGHFVIGACFPGEDKSDAMAEVDVYGLIMKNHHTTCQLGQGGSYNGTITVTNNGNMPQTGVRVEQHNTPVGCKFSFPVISKIEAGESLDIPYTINTIGNDGTIGMKRMDVSVKTNEGAQVEHTIDYSIEPIRGCLKTDSTSIAMNMTLGVAREFPITIWNEGMAPSGAISLTLPDWIQSVTPQQMPSLASGDSVTVILRIVPNDKMYLNISKAGHIGINCTDGTGLSLPIEVTPVSDQNGTFTIDVLDEFAYCTEEKPHVSGATVQVINRATQAVVAEGVTNAEGKFTADIPEGWYRLKVTADYHEAYDKYLLVDPGTNKTKTVFLSFNGVTMEWKVEETEVEDEYTMETVVKYESQVPPPYIDVIWPKEKPQAGKYYPVTIVNKGLIKFYNVKANLSISSRKYIIDIIGNSEIDSLAAGQAVVLYAKLSLKNNPNLSRNVSRIEDNTDSQEPSEGQGTISDECAELIANIEGLYYCGEPVDKEFIERLRLGNCKTNKPHTGSGIYNSSSDSWDAIEESEEIVCDLPKFKIVAADDVNVQYARRKASKTIGHVEKEWVTMRGVAVDGVSKVRIVLDGEYDTSRITDVMWEIDESTNHGSLLNPNLLEGAEYVAPESFPENCTSPTYNVNIRLKCKKDGEEKTYEKAVEVELIRVPVLMVHGLNSNPYDCWSDMQNYLLKNGYKKEYFVDVNYSYTHNQSFKENMGKVKTYVENTLERFFKSKYFCSSVDIIAHSMGGLLTKQDIQTYDCLANKIHKFITINTPHGGSQLGDLLNDPAVQFVRDIEAINLVEHIDFPDFITPDNSLSRKLLRYAYDTFSPKEWITNEDHTEIVGWKKGDISKGAVRDLSVESTEIDNLNNNKTKDVRCHAIVTTSDLSDINGFVDFIVWVGTSFVDLIKIPECLGFSSLDICLKTVYNNDKYDIIVPEQSQYGGLSGNSSTKLPGGYTFCHWKSCHNEEVQKKVLNLLNISNKSSDFSDGFAYRNPPKYNKIKWETILKEYPYRLISNADKLYKKYREYNPVEFDSWKPSQYNTDSRTRTKNAPSSCLDLECEYIQGDTLIRVKVIPSGYFTEVGVGYFFNDVPYGFVSSTEGTLRLPNKIKGDVIVMCEGKGEDGEWHVKVTKVSINTIGSTTMQELSFDQDSLLIINDEYLSPKVLCTWSDGTVTEVENPTLSVTNGNLAYIEDNKYVYGKNKGHTNLVARYGNLSCSTPLEVYITGEDDEVESGNGGGDDQKSVCSTVTLSFKQRSVMTRQAFRGTLTLNNNHPSLPLENVKLHVEVRDEDGTLATQHEFQINLESLNGDFTGELDFDSGWELRSGGTGVVTVLFIPTRYAAPTEPKQWSFGGTVSYTDPFTGLVVTHKLKPVTLTVNPTPILDFTYFMQRDVMGDDPMTENATEESIPAEFALLINNKGNADAKNLKFVCKQPQIIENKKGLLVDFSIESAQLNGENKVLTLSNDIPIEVGTISAQSQAYMQWWLKSSLLGHFNEYDVSFDHKTSYGNEELSLIDQVSIHELIHGFTPLATEQNDSKRAFLVNDTEDAQDMPDRIYFTNATQKEVTAASVATITRQSGTDYLLTVTPTQQGWTYAIINNPLNDKAKVLSITRQSDGTELPVDNLWLTDRTLRDGEVAQVDKKLHFIGEVPEGGEQFLIVFEYMPDRQLKVDTIKGVPAEDKELACALTELTVCFNKPINEETFTVDDLNLFHEGTMVDLSTATISKIDEQTYQLNLGQATSEVGYYSLMVNTHNITDSDGFEGSLNKVVSWTQSEIMSVTDVSQLTDAIYITPINVHNGGDAQMEICLKNSQSATAYLFDLVLPKGITVKKGSNGKYIDTSSDRHDDHTCNINYRGDNIYTLSTLSGNSEELTGNDGVIRRLTLHIADNVSEGVYAINIKTASYSKLNGTLVKLQNTTSTVTVEGFVMGDVNGNGQIDIGDAVSIVNSLVGKENTVFVEKAADTNRNGQVDIGDAVTIVNFLVGKTASLARRHYLLNEREPE